ncbi:putative FK506 suppressor Sfk1 [Phyllosticta citricarpa]|uniref:FK506 suppressor Sfk1 n=2 Tax=Phyllosticta TaxID=121621 RepID=A0ABR1LNB2_9PEZI
MWGISYWIVPLFSGMVWLAMLLGMLLTWVVDGEPHYSSMNDNQHIAYISDIGAGSLKPMFIAMSAVTVVSFDLVFIFERWLRHSGRLHPNTSWFQKICSIICIIAAIAGAAGLILLSIFDTKRHPSLHDAFLVLFIAGYIISAIAICVEYQRLGVHHRRTILHVSFWMKIGFIIIELGLAIAFGVMNQQNRYNMAAILEWVIALIFTFYVWSFFVDFIPAVRTKHHQSRETTVEMAEEAGSQDRLYPHHRNMPMANGYYPPRGATASPAAAAGHF